jgi:glycosyltransferase involved in cell wall biosynthesis
MNTSFVSVIIPVLNDSKRLKICLEALENQTYPKNLYEVIVVDNGSEEDIQALVTNFGQGKYISETRPGSYIARNKGLSIAKGEVIAFTDADCIPAPDWLEKGAANLLKVPNCGLVAGKIEIFYKNPSKPTAVELYESFVAFPQKYFVEIMRFGATANVFTTKTVIEHVGNFNEKLKSGGDTEWGQRVFSSGYKLFYADDTCISHPGRYSLRDLYKKHIRLADGQYNLIIKRGRNTFVNFLENTYKEMFPSISSIHFIISNEIFKQINSQQKLKVILVGLSVRLLRVMEKLRLLFGGRAIS